MNERKIKEYADYLCKQYGPVHITKIRERKEAIIEELMKKFDIDHDYAEKCFENNKDR